MKEIAANAYGVVVERNNAAARFESIPIRMMDALDPEKLEEIRDDWRDHQWWSDYREAMRILSLDRWWLHREMMTDAVRKGLGL